MNETVSLDTTVKPPLRRFVSLDFARGIAILIMVILHIVKHILDTDTLMSDTNIVTEPIIALSTLIIILFFDGIAGFIVSIIAIVMIVGIFVSLSNNKIEVLGLF